MTDRELNEVINSQDRRVWGFTKDANGMMGNGAGYAYEIYVSDGRWSGMDRGRMLAILRMMSKHPYRPDQKARINELIDKLI